MFYFTLFSMQLKSVHMKKGRKLRPKHTAEVQTVQKEIPAANPLASRVFVYVVYSRKPAHLQSYVLMHNVISMWIFKNH